jgi:hypothetical protein
MNLKKMIIRSLLLSIGLILHQIAPPILFGMKPDILLSMMFIAIVITKDYKTTLLIGLVAGFLTATTTTFPGGQLPNIIDKFVTCNFIYLILKVFNSKVNNQIQMIIISIASTLISGIVFLGSAYVLVGLPGPFFALMLAVVLPATIINTIACAVLYNATTLTIKRVGSF